MMLALRTVRSLRLPRDVAYVLAAPLLLYFSARPRARAHAVYTMWLEPDTRALQAMYAPLRWRPVVNFARRLGGSSLRYVDTTLGGVRAVMIDGSGPSEARENDERPAVLFVPGGGFVTDFEAADLPFLQRWARDARVVVIYVTYAFAPQRPYPQGMLNVLSAYRALREHDHALGFRASPLILASLSAGSNLATAAILAPTLQHAAGHSRASPLAALSPLPPVAMPDAILLVCPVLNLCRSPSPSRLAFTSDVLLPMPLLKAFANAYDQGIDHWQVGAVAQYDWLTPPPYPTEARRMTRPALRPRRRATLTRSSRPPSRPTPRCASSPPRASSAAASTLSSTTRSISTRGYAGSACRGSCAYTARSPTRSCPSRTSIYCLRSRRRLNSRVGGYARRRRASYRTLRGIPIPTTMPRSHSDGATANCALIDAATAAAGHGEARLWTDAV